MNDQRPIEERIAERTDLTIAGATEVSGDVGGLAFRDMGQVLEFSKLMAVSGQAVPKHLRGVPGACLAVSLQALNWRMDPFAVANKSYAVNDRIAYEAQLIHAVIEQRAPITGRIKGKYEGEGTTRKCILWATSAEDGERIEYEGPEIGKITIKNSPLWKADPDQQLWYYSVRAMCRRHFPDVILGVYERDEIEGAAPIRDVTPAPSRFRQIAQDAKVRASDLAGPTEEQSRNARHDGPDAHWTEGVDLADALPGDPLWDDGVKAYQAGVPRKDCPVQDHREACHWLGGWDAARVAQELEDEE